MTDTVAFVQEWMMSGDHAPTQWDRDFAAAIDARCKPASDTGTRVEAGEVDAPSWLRERLRYLIQFYIYAEATEEDVQSVIDGLSENDEFDDKVAALVQMPKWCDQDEAQEAVSRHFATSPATATEGVRDHVGSGEVDHG